MLTHMLAVLLGLSVVAVQAAEPPRPNVLLVLADDVGWGDPKCYNPDSRIPTPNIDRLAADGMRFTHAHTPAALCAPTRYAMLSGNYPWRGRNPGGTWGINVPSQFRPGQQAVGNMLQAAGYRTALFGKAGTGGYYAFTAGDKRPGPLAPIACAQSWVATAGGVLVLANLLYVAVYSRVFGREGPASF